MIRLGSLVRHVTQSHYAAYYIGHYRCKRDEQLALARAGDEDAVVMAREAHRNMLRCIRDYRRQQRMEAV